jgi:hypothetical protein
MRTESVRSTFLLVTFLAFFLCYLGCSRESETASQQEPALDASGTRWACQSDDDCMNSCAHGAVNRSWYLGNTGTFSECKDGCANQVSAPPRCIEGSCVAFQRDPRGPGKVTRRDGCTRKGEVQRFN